MGLKQKAKEFFINSKASISPREIFYLITHSLLSLLIPLSFLLLARLSSTQYYLQSLTWYDSPSYLLSLSLHSILYVLLSIVSVASLIHGLTGKISSTLLINDSINSTNNVVFQPRLYTAWILLCTFQVCVGLGIEGSIQAGVLYDFDVSNSFGVERSLISRVIFLLGLHETMQIWSRMVVRPVVDDTVFGIVDRKERWIERVTMAGCLGILWWWKLKNDVEVLVVMAEVKKQQLMDVGLADFVGWWLYYLTVTIGMVRVVKGAMWMGMICLCRRRAITEVSTTVEAPAGENLNDDKV